MNAVSIFGAIAGTTFRALLGRRRTLLMGILALIPVLIAILYRLAGEGMVDDRVILDLLIVRTVLPLTALVFGTTALGAELDDGTGVALLTKPIPRWQIILAKIAVAGTVSALFAAASTIVTELVLGPADPAGTARDRVDRVRCDVRVHRHADDVGAGDVAAIAAIAAVQRRGGPALTASAAAPAE